MISMSCLAANQVIVDHDVLLLCFIFRFFKNYVVLLLALQNVIPIKTNIIPVKTNVNVNFLLWFFYGADDVIS